MKIDIRRCEGSTETCIVEISNPVKLTQPIYDFFTSITIISHPYTFYRNKTSEFFMSDTDDYTYVSKYNADRIVDTFKKYCIDVGEELVVDGQVICSSPTKYERELGSL